MSECGKVGIFPFPAGVSRWSCDRRTTSTPHTDTMLLAFPPDIWEIIFELLSVQDLQLISKVRSPTSPPDASLTQSSLGP